MSKKTPDVGNALTLFSFDERPIELMEGASGFKLTARAARPVGRPTFEQWHNAVQFAQATRRGSPYWVGDLMRYAEGRADYQERLSQAIDATGYEVQTIQNLTSICNRVDEDVRESAPSIGHADIVAALPKDEQIGWLEKAHREGWSIREFRMELKASARKRVIEGQAKLRGKFRVIYADPPWNYGEGQQPSGSTAKAHYPPMTMEQIAGLPIEAHSHDAAVLFMWVTSPLLFANPGPRDVMEAWGFTYKASVVWDKVIGNYGHYTHVNHEILTIGTRGSCLPDRPTPQPDSVQTERRGEHSAKPESFRVMIEKLYDGPYLELFGREKVKGWTVFGNDARLWQSDARQTA